MKKMMYKLGPIITSAAFSMAFTVFGASCRTWYYQPPTPAKLLEMDQ